MKRRLLTIIAVTTIMLATCVVGLWACGQSGEDAPKTYTIQYSYGDNIYQIEVKSGMPYKIETIPVKEGHTFKGLFDAEVGGTQYVGANGASVSTFNAKKHLVLFPQFTANEYKFILDYQDADAVGVRQFDVSYGKSLPELPNNLTVEHKVFNGWYTDENCSGVQVADRNGLIPLVSVVNFDNFALGDDSVILYAGFEYEKYAVTMHFGEGIDSEVMQIEYGTPVSKIVPKTRVEGKAPLLWSATQDGETLTGKVEGEMTIYAKEYAPVIELDLDGGSGAIPVVERAGEHIDLPIPTKSLSKFMYWQDGSGNKYTSRVMPSSSITLKAIWQAMLVFDENGGSDVEDISLEAGETIALPTPEKDGYIFAGWYQTDKKQYTSTTMPTQGIALKAGWYKAYEKTVTLISNNKDDKVIDDSNVLKASKRLKVNLSDVFPTIPQEGITIYYTINFKWGNTYKYVLGNAQIALYESEEFISQNQLAYKSLSHGDDRDSYITDSLSGVSTIHNNILYVYYAGAGKLHITLSGGYGDDVAFYDVNIELKYPDTTTLYL